MLSSNQAGARHSSLANEASKLTARRGHLPIKNPPLTLTDQKRNICSALDATLFQSLSSSLWSNLYPLWSTVIHGALYVSISESILLSCFTQETLAWIDQRATTANNL